MFTISYSNKNAPVTRPKSGNCLLVASQQYATVFLCTLLPFLLVFLTACKPPVETEQQPEKSFTYLVIDNYQIPELTTPEEQLIYAGSAFENPDEKSAALKAVSIKYPDDRHHSGLAALELAFLQLGDDFRLADKHQCSRAAANYLEIIKDYRDFPGICAKALWYLGWISSDLRGETELGISYYLKIIRQYPDEQIGPLVPAPWLSIYLEEVVQKYPPFYSKAPLSWADLAHLEIIRHSTDINQAWHSYRAIRQRNPIGGIDGSALKILAGKHGITQEISQLIGEYLRSDAVDAILKNDLHSLLSTSR